MDLIYGQEERGVYPASYYVATAAGALPFPALDGGTTCDVCVIGAGYTGLSAALHLAGEGLDVVLIDAQRVGWGASGRNGGQIWTGQRVDQMSLEKMVGMERARALWQISEDAKALVRSLVAGHDIACDLKPGLIHADHKSRYVADTRREVDHLNDVYGYDKISFLDKAALEECLGTKAYFGGFLDWGAGHLHPLNFALGLSRAAAGAGVRIFEQTRATGLICGDPATVRTAAGDIRANHVILAANGYLGDLEPEVAARVMPINSYIVATEPLSEELAHELIRDGVAVGDSRFVVNYYRLSADRRMLFGGRESYGYRFPADIATAVRTRMLSVYPQLEDARIDYSWGGTLGITMNRMPCFTRPATNMLSASGFSGHGVAMATMAGKILAEAVAGQAGRFETMAAVPTHRFPGGRALRQPLLTLAMLYYALRDRI